MKEWKTDTKQIQNEDGKYNFTWTKSPLGVKKKEKKREVNVERDNFVKWNRRKK